MLIITLILLIKRNNNRDKANKRKEIVKEKVEMKINYLKKNT